jgi:hypothetical protein
MSVPGISPVDAVEGAGTQAATYQFVPRTEHLFGEAAKQERKVASRLGERRSEHTILTSLILNLSKRSPHTQFPACSRAFPAFQIIFPDRFCRELFKKCLQ